MPFFKDEYYALMLKIIFISVSGFMFFFILFSDFREIIFRVPDDASYYLKIAENYNSGKGFSFDGIHKTNGFQPLWQYMLIALTFVSRTNAETTLRIVLILQVILLFISGFLFYKFLSNQFTKRIILICGMIFILFVFFQSVNAMETALLVLMISIILYFSERVKILDTYNLKYDFILGILFGLLVLTRLDSIFFAVPAGIFLIVKVCSDKSVNKSYTGFILILSGFVLVTAPYLIYNYSEFGSIIPVSGYLKSAFPEIAFKDKLSNLLKYRETYFALCSVIYLMWYIKNSVKGSSDIYKTYLAVMSAGNILLFAYMIFFLNWVIFPWYFITYSLFVSLAVCVPVKYFFSRNNSRTAEIIYLSITLFISLYWGIKTFNFYLTDQKTLGGNWNIESYNASQWAKRNTGTGDVFAMKDAGNFGFFSGRSVINLDGLVNNFDYQEVLRKKDLNTYLKDNAVKYIVQHAVWDRDDITTGEYDSLSINYFSHKYSAESDPVILKKKNEIYRSEPYYDGEYKSVFLIWRYDH
ncbi:MAG TPA: glycosyltransferase family 39 protein [Ignavibacteria bacterium]|nr:glycosyltransferase family 39 protein [Ignavibacteria bacterium]